MTVFWGIRGLTNLPVESLFTGGMAWFTDLTTYDPYYVIPALTAITLWVTLETGSSSQVASTTPYQKWFFRSVPLIAFPFLMHFPAVRFFDESLLFLLNITYMYCTTGISPYVLYSEHCTAVCALPVLEPCYFNNRFSYILQRLLSINPNP